MNVPRPRTSRRTGALNWEQVHARRLSRSHLLEQVTRRRLVQAVSDVGGVQAQVLAAAEWAIGARVAGTSEAQVADALWKTRRLVKTFGPRGTLHLLPASEVPLWLAARRALPPGHEGAWRDQSNLTATQAQALFAALRDALDGCALTRAELADAVSARLGAWVRERLASTWADLISVAAMAGVLCFGPPQGSRVTFVRLDQWTGGWKELDPLESLREVLRRYLSAYAPARPQDFAQWFAGNRLKPVEARELFASLADELEPVQVGRQRAWILAADARKTWEPVRGSLRLLPQYDCYLLGWRFGREHLVPQAARQRIFAFKNGRFEGATGIPVLLVDGVVAGMWERRRRARRVEIRVEPFIRLSAVQREQLEAEVLRIGQFRDEPAVLSLTAFE